MRNEIIAELTRRRAQVSEVGGTLNVRLGTGPMSQSVNIDPTTFIDWLTARDPATHRRDLASWASGVETTLLEPRVSDARSWSFVEAAGSIFPTIEGPAFAQGVSDATGGEPAWVTPLDGDLVTGWVLRLNRGIRPLTAAQVDNWGVTADRIIAAGRSLLFHATRPHQWQPTESVDVVALRVGDGHDAARLMVVGDVYFTEVDEQWRFAIPHPDILLAVRDPRDTSLLVDAAIRSADAAPYPLDSRIWRIGPWGPVLHEG